MRVQDALEQLDAIHEQLTKAEVYRGFKVPGVALIGVLGLLAAVVQPRVPGAEKPTGFVLYWVVIAAVGGSLGFGTVVHA